MSEYFKNKYRIDSHRLKDWDYRTPGWYFVTICTLDGIHFLGKVNSGIIRLSECGCIAWKYWYEIPNHHSHVRLGEFIVMPNHVHLTVRLLDRKIDNSTVETCHGTSLHQVDNSFEPDNPIAAISPKSGSLSIIINQFKGAVRRWCKENGHNNFAWQPGFYDHVVRDQKSLTRIHYYICSNMGDWAKDRYHPENLKDD